YDKSTPGDPILTLNGALCCYNDHQQNLWIGHMAGASRLNASAAQVKSWSTEFRFSSAQPALLNVVKGADGCIYQSVFGAPWCYKINPATNAVTALDSRQLPPLWCVNRLGNEIVFAGGSTTITNYDPVGGRYRQSDFLKTYFPKSEIVILALKQRNGDEWYSGNIGGGLVRISAGDGNIHHYKKDGPRGHFSISYYVCHGEDANGDLWLGVNKSSRLLHWERRRDTMTEIVFDTVKGAGKAFAGIQDITMDSAGNVWVAFDGAGVLCYAPSSNTARAYDMRDGLPTNYVNGLLFDDKNRLWMATSKGLSCLLVSENRCLTYTIDDGLPEDEFVDRCLFFDTAAHKLWACSKTTLMSFEPDRLLSMSRRKVPVYIDEIMLNGKKLAVDTSGELQFRPTQNNLQFYFIGVDFNNGKSIEYSYRLSGADEDWIYNDHITTASYANLGPGNYSFLVRARHKGETAWSVAAKPFAFTILKPWFKTWWFRALLIALAATGLILLVRRYLSRQLEKQKIIMEKELAIEQERTRMARELHDGLGSMLSGVKHSFSAMQQRLDLTESQQAL
ncbi:MAG: hypothetical protein JST39_25245, partial [Bacteroidetes bacterium]|nr:hypothetical protein [Bacteroidota bacterium]